MMPDSNLISRVYGNFRGVDFRGEEINLMRSPDSLNVWKDYKETESIRTRPELELSETFDETVYGVFFYEVGSTEMMLVHSGTTLYKVAKGEKTVVHTGLNPAKSDCFIYNNYWYFKDGMNYLKYDGTTMTEIEGYVPTTTIARKPAGGGTKHEDINLLTGRRINTFLADGTSKEYFLDAQDIDKDFAPIVKINDAVVNTYTVDYAAGKITFNTAPTEPLTDGQDNVSVEFKKDIAGYRDKINKCTLLQVFDNRVFFSGNSEFPNMIWHCSLSDPSYCSDLDYYNEGLDNAKVKGLVAGNNVLWVFKEPSQANTTVFYHTPTIDSEYGKIYPSTHSSISTGCVGKAINFNDDIIFFSARGMEGISGDITTEQAIAHRSTLVDRKLISEADYENMVLEEWEGYLIVFVGNKVYLADSRATYTNENHIEYEWFYWELGHKVTSAKVNKGVLYIGTENGVYTLTDNAGNVESYWVTPKDKFKYPQHLKTSNKRGCVAEATGDISVYAKTEKTDFELIGTYENVRDYFVSRIKRKKFKDIQLKFHSNTRFS
ncbi:MAG: hypothetical protein J6V02_03040, partial [Bacteroidaceae bacterium]|nr:hypothetical protein [Bacteroidaceae bacterium]